MYTITFWEVLKISYFDHVNSARIVLCRSLSIVVIRCATRHFSLSLVITHLLPLVVSLAVTRYHLLLLSVSLVCLFIDNRSMLKITERS